MERSSPETPGANINPVPQVASSGVTMSHVNIPIGFAALNEDSGNANIEFNIDENENDNENEHLINDNMNMNMDMIRNDTPGVLDFPVMHPSRPLEEEGGIDPSQSESSTSATIASDWNMSLNRETVRRERRRARANSFDEAMPMPRIALRPRFRKQVNAVVDVDVDAVVDAVVPPFSASHTRHEFNSNSNNNRNSSRTIQRRPSRSRHFRNHTYGGSDASTDIFTQALSLDASFSGIRNIFSAPPVNNSYDHTLQVSSQEIAPTLQIVHNSFK